MSFLLVAMLLAPGFGLFQHTMPAEEGNKGGGGSSVFDVAKQVKI